MTNEQDFIKIQNNDTVVVISTEAQQTYILVEDEDHPLGIFRIKINTCEEKEIMNFIKHYDFFPRNLRTFILSGDEEKYFISRYTDDSISLCLSNHKTQSGEIKLKAFDAPLFENVLGL